MFYDEVNPKQAEKDYIKALNEELDSAYRTINYLIESVNEQDLFIDKLRQRLKDHDIKFLEKSIFETTREELAAINKCIPTKRTLKADNPNKLKMPTFEEQKELYSKPDNNLESTLSNLVKSLVSTVDLEKYNIDPATLHFKEGYGPNGKIIPVKPTLLHKVKNFFKR